MHKSEHHPKKSSKINFIKDILLATRQKSIIDRQNYVNLVFLLQFRFEFFFSIKMFVPICQLTNVAPKMNEQQQ